MNERDICIERGRDRERETDREEKRERERQRYKDILTTDRHNVAAVLTCEVIS